MLPKNHFKLFYCLLLSTWLWSCEEDPETPQEPINTNPVELSTRVVINTLNTPWELVWGPDNYIWVTERYGRISRVHPETGAQEVLLTATEVRQNSEGGLLGMVLHPDFRKNPFVYVFYNYDNTAGYRGKLVRFRYENKVLSSPSTLLDNIPASSIHNGCRLLVTRDNKLLLTTGDAANPGLAQNLSSLAGKTLRINLDGSIPADNPIPGSYIYSYGHRNAQGMAYHPSGRIYQSEHGPAADDEFNLLLPNRNYGWPDVVGAVSSAAETSFASGKNIVEPVLAWTPTIATCDLEWYGNVAIPQWRNTFLLATLKDQRLIALTLNAEGTAVVKEESFFDRRFGRLRAVLPAPDGRVFLANNLSGNNSQIIEIKAKTN